MNKIIFTISTILIFSIVPISAREDISIKCKKYTIHTKFNTKKRCFSLEIQIY